MLDPQKKINKKRGLNKAKSRTKDGTLYQRDSPNFNKSSPFRSRVDNNKEARQESMNTQVRRYCDMKESREKKTERERVARPNLSRQGRLLTLIFCKHLLIANSRLELLPS